VAEARHPGAAWRHPGIIVASSGLSPAA
jgi:hypothetical protein